MSSVALYERIYQEHSHKIKSGEIEIDPYLLNRAHDSRRGISLVIPVRGITHEYETLVTRFRAIDPAQYYYPAEDLHITVFDFVQATEGYTRNKKQETAFLEICHKALSGRGQFSVRLSGLVFSSAAGLIQGFDNDKLITIRNDIRQLMSTRGLRNDERYESGSAHCSFCRFSCPLSNPLGLGLFINDCRTRFLGTLEVAAMELVEHDWYNSTPTKRLIASFALGKGG